MFKSSPKGAYLIYQHLDNCTPEMNANVAICLLDLCSTIHGEILKGDEYPLI